MGNVLVTQSNVSGALSAYRKGFDIAEAMAVRDLANTQWQHNLWVSHDRIGKTLVAQNDLSGALSAYRKGMAIAEALTTRDSADTQWQTDLAISCARLGTLSHKQNKAVRRDYLLRGRGILVQLKGEGRLFPNQGWIKWFDKQLAKLPK
jgi:hypothetical protein